MPAPATKVRADPTSEFFAALAERGHEPILQSAEGTLRFDLADGKRDRRSYGER